MLRAFLLAGLLTACAGGPVSEDGGGLRQFFREDVQRALDLATRTNDENAIKCWTYILVRTPDASMLNPGEQESGSFGIATAYQVARTTRRSLDGIRSQEYFDACGPMEMESRAAIRRGIRGAFSPF